MPKKFSLKKPKITVNESEEPISVIERAFQRKTLEVIKRETEKLKKKVKKVKVLKRNEVASEPDSD